MNGHSQQRRTRRGVAELLCLASSGEASSADSSSGAVDRRALLSGGLALAAATALQSSLPANAGQVVSSDWEKVGLPVDPGVVLLDIGFTDEKHGARLPFGRNPCVLPASSAFCVASVHRLCHSLLRAGHLPLRLI